MPKNKHETVTDAVNAARAESAVKKHRKAKGAKVEEPAVEPAPVTEPVTVPVEVPSEPVTTQYTVGGVDFYVSK